MTVRASRRRIALPTLLALASVVPLSGCGSSDDGSETTKITTGTTDALPKSAQPVRLTYIADSPYGKKVTQRQLDDGVTTLRRRAKGLGLNDTAVRKKGDRVVITYPPDDFASSASSQLPVQGRLFFYDFDADVIGNPNEPIKTIYEAVASASKRKPVSSRDNTTGKQFYMFGELRNYRGGPVGSRKTLLARFRNEKPPKTRIFEVPPGTIVPLSQPLSNALDAGGFDGDYVMRDRPMLDNADIENVRFVDDEGSDGKPGVEFDFTAAGRAKFQRLTKRVAVAGSKDSPNSVAAVLDIAILSKVPVPPDEFPDGLDGRDGAVLSGALTAEQAKHLAAVLDSGSLPFRLVPVLQEQVRGR